MFLTATLSRLTFDLGQLGVELTLLLCTSHLLQDQYSLVKGAGKTHSEDCVCGGVKQDTVNPVTDEELKRGYPWL